MNKRVAFEGRTVRSRFTPKPTSGLRIEKRDEQFLSDLFLHRAMSRGQIQALYFTSVMRCNARLRQLFDHTFVSRYYLPAAPYGSQAIYSIGSAAVPIVARHLEIELHEVSRQYRRTKTPTFMEHTLSIVDMRLAFREAVKYQNSIEIERWLPETLCRHEYEIRGEGKGWRKEIFKPDAFVRLLHRNTSVCQSYFIEVDLGHTSSSQFLGKLVSHRRYLESGLFREIFHSDQFKTLVITTGEKRLKNLCSLVETHVSDLFWFTTFEKIHSAGILSKIWQVPFEEVTQSLIAPFT